MERDQNRKRQNLKIYEIQSRKEIDTDIVSGTEYKVTGGRAKNPEFTYLHFCGSDFTTHLLGTTPI